MVSISTMTPLKICNISPYTNQKPTSVPCRSYIVHQRARVLFFLVLFNQTVMLFAVWIVVDSYQQNVTSILKQRFRILFLFYLFHCGLNIFVPLQFHYHCRIRTDIFRLRHKNQFPVRHILHPSSMSP